MAPIVINLGAQGVDWTAWIQAIGSVVAIFAAGVFVRWQHNLETDREIAKEATKRYEFISAVTAVVHNTAALIRSAAKAANDAEERVSYFSDDGDRKKLGNCLDALSAIPVHDLPGYELASRLISLRRTAQDALTSWDALIKTMNSAQHPDSEYGWEIFDLECASQEASFAVKEFTAAMVGAAEYANVKLSSTTQEVLRHH